MKVTQYKIEELIPYENNPRNNEKAVDYVAESIKEFGFKNPIIVDENNVIIAGHTRLEAAKKIGLKEVPVIKADDLTPEQVKAFRLADNKTAEFAEWDESKLISELLSIGNIDMDEFGFDFGDAGDVLNIDDITEDEVPEPPKEPKSKPGDIYKLGKHRLVCGDSTSPEDVKKLMDGKEADLLFTDPPYNVAVSNSKGLTIENDDMDEKEFAIFLNNAMKNASGSLKPGAAFYVWYASKEAINFTTSINTNDMSVRQNLIWVKNGFILGRQDYKWKHEPCLYGWKNGAPHYFIDEYNHPTVIDDKMDLKKMTKDELRETLEELLADKTPTDVIYADKPIVADLHPTMKPIKMCAELIHNSSRPGELVLDLFGGSGSTLIACEQIGRHCYMMEYDPKFVDVIIERWENLTGEKAEKIS